MAGLSTAFGASLKTIQNVAIFTTEIALLVLGKIGFEAVRADRTDRNFTQFLRLKRLP